MKAPAGFPVGAFTVRTVLSAPVQQEVEHRLAVPVLAAPLCTECAAPGTNTTWTRGVSLFWS